MKELLKLIFVGLLDITLILKLSSEIFEMNGINFDNNECVSDLTFLSKCRHLWNEFQLSSNNEQLNFLLQVNKNNLDKIFISFLCLKRINLNDNKNKENRFIIDMINIIVERHWIFLNYDYILKDSNNTNYKEQNMRIIINVYKDEKEMKSISLLTNNDNGEVFQEETEQVTNEDNESHPQEQT